MSITTPSTQSTRPEPTEARISARIDRLPANGHTRGLVARVATGGWLEFYEMFMAGYISLGLIGSGLFHEKSNGYFDLHGYASFTASFFLGMFVSTVLLSRLADVYGRRSTFTYSMVAYSVACVVVAFSATSVLIDIFRFVAGLAIGIQLVNNDAYMAELSPSHVRGRYMSFGYIFVLTSVPIVALLSWRLVPHSPLGLDGWRWVMLIGAVGAVLVWFIRLGLPESPRWLAAHGRLREADAVVTAMEDRVSALAGPIPAVPAATATAVGAESATDTSAAAAWRETFGRAYGPRTLMLSVFQFAQTIAVYGFSNWAPILLAARGLDIVHTLAYSFLIAIATPFGAVLATVLAERIERKWQLVLAAIGIAAFGTVFAAAHATAIVVICGAGIALCNNWLIGAFHPYSAEMFPTRIRAHATGFAFSWSRVSSIFVSYWIADLLASHGQPAVFILIGAAMCAIVVSVGLFGPKTSGRALEELAP